MSRVEALHELVASEEKWLDENSWRADKAMRSSARANIIKWQEEIDRLTGCQPPRVEPPIMSEGQNNPIVGAYDAARKQFIDRPNLTHTTDPLVMAIADPVLAEASRATGVVDDPVRPKHYQGDLVMRIIEHFGLETDFYVANAIKYLLRHREKGGATDIAKARWYLDRAIERAEGKHHDGVK